MWRPKDPKAVALIKLTLWAGLVTWMFFTMAIGMSMARLAAVSLPPLVGTEGWGLALAWMVPIWVIFTTFMLIWAVARFANKKLSTKKESIED